MEIDIEDDSFVGMPFVLLSGGKWMKNQGSDFYVEFGVKPKQIQKVSLCLILLRRNCCLMLFLVFLVFLFVLLHLHHFPAILTLYCSTWKDAGDGRGTAKALLDKIASMESEAQKSFMHR